MDLAAITDELYGLPPQGFTATRNARAAEARRAGDRDLAESIKRLRKPSAGASIANLLVRAQPREIDRLIELGATLRSAKRVDGARLRRATKEKAEAVTKLLRQARSLAKRAGLSLSQPVERELEATLDAAFSDPQSAASLRSGQLIGTLHYSGLGLGADGAPRSSSVSNRSPEGRTGPASKASPKARSVLAQATREAARAEAEAEKAKQAVVTAEADLKRLQAALTVADRKAERARHAALAAQKKAGALGGSGSR